jgi:preprotein translocase subunit SecY
VFRASRASVAWPVVQRALRTTPEAASRGGRARIASSRHPRRLASRLASVLLALVWLGALAPAAIASNGHGFYGETDDKVVTYAGFSLILFFTLFVIVMSLIQGRLDRRKEARKAAARLSVGNGRWRGGW